MHGKMGLNSKLRLWNLLLWILKCHSIYFIRFIIQIETPRPKPCMRASFKPLCPLPPSLKYRVRPCSLNKDDQRPMKKRLIKLKTDKQTERWIYAPVSLQLYTMFFFLFVPHLFAYSSSFFWHRDRYVLVLC